MQQLRSLMKARHVRLLITSPNVFDPPFWPALIVDEGAMNNASLIGIYPYSMNHM